MTPDDVEFRVLYSCGAYVTQTVRGQRASSTMSAEQAAKVLAIKLFPHAAARVERVRDEQEPCGPQIWRASA